jgi:hypothetical protein
MVYSKTFSRPSYPPRRVTSLSACRAAPAAARPTNDGIVEGEIAAFDGFWQGWSLAAMRPKTGEIGASRAGQWRFCWPQDVALPWRLRELMGIEHFPSMRLADGGRGSAISRAMPANRYGGMAAAAIWNTALRPWRTTFAPIL